MCIAEKGSDLMVHGGVCTLHLNAVYWRLKPYAYPDSTVLDVSLAAYGSVCELRLFTAPLH